MSNETLLIIGGIYHIAFFVFHLFFWKIFNWKKSLAPINRVQRGVMQVLNLCLMFAFLIFAYISLFHTHEMLSTGLGSALLCLIAIFWALRTVEQFVFFSIRKPFSIVLLILFIFGTVIYLIPVLA